VNAPRRQLTAREFEVLGLLAEGCTYAQAAARLGISLHTVTSHVKNAYRKLQVTNAAAAVRRVFEIELLPTRPSSGRRRR
jgi:LuxR family maltose regulon positive regulatory protein